MILTSEQVAHAKTIFSRTARITRLCDSHEALRKRAEDAELALAHLTKAYDSLYTKFIDVEELHLADESTIFHLEAKLAELTK